MKNHNWYIGQDVVCVKTHSQGDVKEGDVYTIKGLRDSFCECDRVEIHIGHSSQDQYESCSRCGMTVYKKDSSMWFSESLFAPLDTLTDISEIEEVLSKPAFENI